MIAAVRRVVLQKVRQDLGARQVVDRDHLIPLGLKHLTEGKTPNTAKTIDCNSHCHFYFLPWPSAQSISSHNAS